MNVGTRRLPMWLDTKKLPKNNLNQGLGCTRRGVEPNPANVLQIFIPADEHHTAHRRVRSNTNVRYNSYIRNPLILNYWNQCSFNFAAGQQIPAVRWRRISDQFDGVPESPVLKAPD